MLVVQENRGEVNRRFTRRHAELQIDVPRMAAAEVAASRTATISLLVGRSAGSAAAPLHVAALHGHADAVSLLLGSAANAEERWTHGATPLALAARYGHAGAVAALLAHRADPGVRLADGATPLFLASASGWVLAEISNPKSANAGAAHRRASLAEISLASSAPAPAASGALPFAAA